MCWNTHCLDKVSLMLPDAAKLSARRQESLVPVEDAGAAALHHACLFANSNDERFPGSSPASELRPRSIYHRLVSRHNGKPATMQHHGTSPLSHAWTEFRTQDLATVDNRSLRGLQVANVRLQRPGPSLILRHGYAAPSYAFCRFSSRDDGNVRICSTNNERKESHQEIVNDENKLEDFVGHCST